MTVNTTPVVTDPRPVVFDDVTIRYAGSAHPTLRSVSFGLEEGELVLVTGRTGSGKSTLLGAVNGTVPHFTGGHLGGRVTVFGQDTRTHRPRDLAGTVGVVRQDPLSGFVTDTVEEELAYTLEQLALEPAAMRRRVEEVLDLLGIADLRDAPLRDLSGGQQQRVAIGSVLTASPRLLVLDEPTSALDPTGAEEVLATLARLVHDLGLTVVLSEHRLERIIGFADRVLEVHDDGSVLDGTPRAVMATSPLAPPVVQLGRLAGWEPLPLTVREARRAATTLRAGLSRNPGAPAGARVAPGESPLGGGERIVASGLSVTHGDVAAVRAIDLAVRDGEVAVLMGRNGSGKSSLLWALHGSGPRSAGTVTVRTAGDQRVDPATESPRARRSHVGLVPQNAPDLLYLDSVRAECHQSDHESAAAGGTTRAILDRLAPGTLEDHHPRDLSEGQQLALVLAVQLAATPGALLLDEPTRGLDHPAKEALADLLRDLAAAGTALAVATHDVEFAATVADRVVVLAEGRVVADGPATDVLCDSPAFAPQVAKVLAPARVVRLDQVPTTASTSATLGAP
ncbi:energy-coupling factor transport system ATP-binding protein [Pedococcus dokdonensis]|uniref:Energy-coupling factor transport system ATP-binding protein n=1 Tax=Pedococcus dokdonensis TaxID=443156 RepID=A0A1H0QCL6_9MICO|nr:ATP-binding cassette domain-containing protein [Pedococcus dokdonensis]SDP15123.1 energy-coupling factor transport system ATP-binding protein [Pedococcus dokdonensis]